ncbi:uncharacterized protein LOC130948585 isoform X5 [Arachis stenosperma]|uniref:uncharacterized protein LOC130948585 isoform X5 n=1 Tax=Arachis stenosperma TaxID=217475 RepID=UPI0025AD51B2|nr:uncharacterized protein LOC130948585 isoform X5 [Arachis stenosperma]
MEILDDAVDNMGLSNKKASKFLLVLFIAIPLVFITITSMCKISNNFLPFEGFQKVLLGGKYQNDNNNHNNHSMELEGRGIVQNMTHENLGERGEEKNNTIEVFQGKVQNNCTASQGTVTVILADIGDLNSRKLLEPVLMGIIRSCFSFIAGTVCGIYVAQNYQVPNITKLIDTTLHKAKQVEETYRKPKKKGSDDDNYD